MLFLRGVILALGLHLSRGACDGCESEDSNVLLQHKETEGQVKRRPIRKVSLLDESAVLDDAVHLKDYTFEDYLKEFGKSYGPKEYAERKAIFEKQMKEVMAHNAKGSTFKLGVNEFSDWTPAELKALRGLKKSPKTGSPKKSMDTDTSDLPASFDWRDKGNVVSPPKNQGHCGSCWAFAATATVESAVAIANGFLTILAPQPMVSCAQNPRHCGGTGGCEGATAQIGFEFVMNSSLTYEETVGYQSFWGHTGDCTAEMKYHFSKYPVVSITGYVANPTNEYAALMKALVANGPQAISVDASHWSPYKSGIADFCNNTENIDIDHAVVLIGYGKEGCTKYWTVRNSWGTLWGEEGYIRLIRHDDEQSYCGWDNTPSHGSLCEDETNITKQWVCGTCGILFDTSYVKGAHYVGSGSGDVNR